MSTYTRHTVRIWWSICTYIYCSILCTAEYTHMYVNAYIHSHNIRLDLWHGNPVRVRLGRRSGLSLFIVRMYFLLFYPTTRLFVHETHTHTHTHIRIGTFLPTYTPRLSHQFPLHVPRSKTKHYNHLRFVLDTCEFLTHNRKTIFFSSQMCRT